MAELQLGCPLFHHAIEESIESRRLSPEFFPPLHRVEVRLHRSLPTFPGNAEPQLGIKTNPTRKIPLCSSFKNQFNIRQSSFSLPKKIGLPPSPRAMTW
jgi:hypothetical protein